MLAKLLNPKNLFVAAMLMAPSLHAETIELISKDNTIRIKGELVNFDGEKYTIRTSLGTLAVNASQLNCVGEACPYIKPPTAEFTVSGSKSMSDLLVPKLLEAYSKDLDATFKAEIDQNDKLVVVTDAENDDIAKVRIVSSTSSSGLVDLLQGDSAIALSTRVPRRREIDAFEKSGLGLIKSSEQETVVALDGLLIVTSPDNPIRAISEVNAALIFSGSITNWSQLGGPDAPINVYVRGDESGTTEVFNTIIMRPQALQIRPDATIVDSDEAISGAVAADPNGIGFTSFVHQAGAKALAIEGVCGLQTPPSEFTIKTEEYPLTRRLFLYKTAQEAPVHLKGFIDFVSSDAAQSAIGDAGFVNQLVTSSSVNSQGLRFASAIVANRNARAVPELQDMVRQMLSSERLSTTFRFTTGSASLDNRAQVDIRRLSALLSSDAYVNKTVQLVGFTDSVGDPLLNKQLSERRAQQVFDALLSFNPDLTQRVTFEPIGYGEISPLGCNETAAGRLVNRRVEVWVQDKTNL